MSNQMSQAIGALTDFVKQEGLTGANFKPDTIDKLLKVFEMRQWCLQAVVEIGLARSADDAVSAARTFEAYLDGSSDPQTETAMREMEERG